jgi:hypothetical protein
VNNNNGAKPPRLNWRLIGRVLRYIKRHPERYDQNSWIEYDGATRWSERAEADVPEGQPSMCNTRGCFAGWCVMLSSTQKEWRRLLREAVKDECDVDWTRETAKRCGFTYQEADYLTDGASGDPEADYETIRNRICAIVRARRTGDDFETAEGWVRENGRGARV